MPATSALLLRALLAALIAGAPAAARAPGTPPLPPAMAQLRERLAQVAALPGGGRVGIAAIDLASGARVGVHAAERFPMASTYKVAIAAAFLHQVELGQASLDAEVPVELLRRNDSDGVADRLPGWGLERSARGLIELMLRRSDNSATDAMLELVGGPGAVSEWLRQVGIPDQRVDRGVAQMILDNEGTTVPPALTAPQALKMQGWSPPSPVNIAFDADPRDSSTPDAMALLLARLARGEILGPENTWFLVNVMARCETGRHRVARLLPPGTGWAHKTGTLAGIANDVGIMRLPDGHFVALAIFLRGVQDPRARDAVVAELGRTLYDGMLLAQ